MSTETCLGDQFGMCVCVSLVVGVPISTQWGPQGYFYPIQIAQYGLSHYSKYLMDQSRSVTMLEDAESGDASRWMLLDQASTVDNVWEPQARSHVIQFRAKGRSGVRGQVTTVIAYQVICKM